MKDLQIYKKTLTNTQYKVVEFIYNNPDSRNIDIRMGLDMTGGNVASVLNRLITKDVVAETAVSSEDYSTWKHTKVYSIKI